jgi:hypothetical protein
MLTQFPLLEGATLAGRLDGDGLDLELHGVTTDAKRALDVRIVAQLAPASGV